MNVCQCCLKLYQDSDLNLHHLTHDRLWNELDEDLVLVCVLCHERLHKDETGKIPLYWDHLKNRYECIRKRRYIS